MYPLIIALLLHTLSAPIALGAESATTSSTTQASEASQPSSEEMIENQTTDIPATENPRFSVWEYQVQGNTVLPRETIERTVYAHLGENKSIDDIEKARLALQDEYQKAGYPTVMVDIPEQDVVGGVVRLTITEGSIGRVKVTGSRYFSLGRIKQRLPALAENVIPNKAEIEKQLNQLNLSTTDRQVTPVLKPGKEPGKLDVELQVKDNLPLHGSLELNNRYSADTSELRLQGALQYANLWQLEHNLALQFQIAPMDPSQVNVLSALYSLPVPDTDIRLIFSAIRSRSNVSSIGDTLVIGNSDIFGMQAYLPLPTVGNFTHSLTFGLSYKDVQENITLGNAAVQETPIDYLPFTADYSASFRDDTGRTQFNLGTTFSFRGLTDNNVDCPNQPPTISGFINEFECKRAGARSDFFYVTTNLERWQELPNDMQLIAKLNAQLADQPLINNEQFSVGGPVGGMNHVRGYLQSEILADAGLYGGLELQSQSFAYLSPDAITDLRFLSFIEGASVSTIRPLPGQAKFSGILGAGLGFRARLLESINVALDWGWPFLDGERTKAGDYRFHFLLGYDF